MCGVYVEERHIIWFFLNASRTFICCWTKVVLVTCKFVIEFSCAINIELAVFFQNIIEVFRQGNHIFIVTRRESSGPAVSLNAVNYQGTVSTSFDWPWFTFQETKVHHQFIKPSLVRIVIWFSYTILVVQATVTMRQCKSLINLNPSLFFMKFLYASISDIVICTGSLTLL